MKQYLFSYLKKNFIRIFLCLLAAICGSFNMAAIALDSTSISFTGYFKITKMRQRFAGSLPDYSNASENVPVSVALKAADPVNYNPERPPDTSRRPCVMSINPQNNSINVSENSSVSTNILKLPNSGINNTTITSANVYLTEQVTGTAVPSTVNGTGGGDAITLVPDTALKPNTTYMFTITSGVKDLSDSSFMPYSASFTTGAGSAHDIANIKFDKIALPNTEGQHSTLTMGPDGKLYALTIDGIIQRYVINPDGTLQPPQLIYTLQDEYASRNPRLSIGLCFDPSSTANNLIAWVTHSTFVFLNGPDLDGKLSKLSGPDLENIQDIVIDLPRSVKDHLTNSIAFGPDGALYFTQASTSAMGRADNTWGNRNEHLLSAACLRLDVTKINSFPLDAKTAESGGTYDPYAADAPLTLYATGVRNAYDLLWHSNGNLYLPTNGSAAGGNTPASVAGTLRPDGTHYNGPVIPALTYVQQTQNDYLFRITKGGYYGHPNPARGEYVLNGGNSVSSDDAARVTSYPSGTAPDANYRGYAFNFQMNKSPDGVIEYKSNTFNGALKGKILVVRYSQNNDIITLTPGGPNNDIISAVDGASITGFSGFADPLDLTEDTATGDIYVSEYGDNGRITLLRPQNNFIAQSADKNETLIADAYIHAGNYANHNYGQDSVFVVKASPAKSFSRRAYLKFSSDSVSAANASYITSATLKIYGHNIENSDYINLAVFGINDDTWTEDGINWYNAPASSAPALSYAAVNDQPHYYDFDITDYVKQQAAGDKVISLLLKDTAKSNRKLVFNSRENANFPPRLVIVTSQLNAPQQSITTQAVITNTPVAKRIASVTVQQKLIARTATKVYNFPGCDQPGDDYVLQDSAHAIIPVAATPSALNSLGITSINSTYPIVYPNPLQHIFHIRFPESYKGNYRMQLNDVSGRKYDIGIAKLLQGGTDVSVNISKLALKPGVYFLDIYSATKAGAIIKLLIQY